MSPTRGIGNSRRGQLPGAVALLQERNGNATPVDDVRLITITIGGNDVFNPVIAACGWRLHGQQAAAFDAVVVETGSIGDPSEARPDCLHPNAAGHADIAEAFADAVSGSVVGGSGC